MVNGKKLWKRSRLSSGAISIVQMPLTQLPSQAFSCVPQYVCFHLCTLFPCVFLCLFSPLDSELLWALNLCTPEPTMVPGTQWVLYRICLMNINSSYETKYSLVEKPASLYLTIWIILETDVDFFDRKVKVENSFTSEFFRTKSQARRRDTLREGFYLPHCLQIVSISSSSIANKYNLI